VPSYASTESLRNPCDGKRVTDPPWSDGGYFVCAETSQFLEADLKTPLPNTFTFAAPEKIKELARRGAAWGTSEARQMPEHAKETGRGGVYLRLTPEQYRKLRRL
jgi:hypothetical protein